LVSELSLRQQLLTLSQCLFRLQYFMIFRQFATRMIFLSLLKAACHYHRQTHTECFGYPPIVKVTCHYLG
jgi:hypothetical protein